MQQGHWTHAVASVGLQKVGSLLGVKEHYSTFTTPNPGAAVAAQTLPCNRIGQSIALFSPRPGEIMQSRFNHGTNTDVVWHAVLYKVYTFWRSGTQMNHLDERGS